MSSTISPAREVSPPSTLTTVSSQEPAPEGDSQTEVFQLALPLDITSNVRQGSPTPNPPSLNVHLFALLSRQGTVIPCDPIYDLPAPDLTPRFTLRLDEPSDEETPPGLVPDAAYDFSAPIQPTIKQPTSPSPRIYFGDSAITFVPPFCYDFLERDPNVKAVPRNYRAWMRSGRPKLDVEGLERAEAKHDFLAMGLPFPPDTESEESGNEKEKEKKRKRKRRLAARALMVPIERPRRMVRKTGGANTPTNPFIPAMGRIDKNSEDDIPRSGAPVLIIDESKDRMVSKAAEKSDCSERRSSSTLLDMDIEETTPKKRFNSGQYCHLFPCQRSQMTSPRQ